MKSAALLVLLAWATIVSGDQRVVITNSGVSGACDAASVATGAANCPLLTASDFGISGGVLNAAGFAKLPNPPFANNDPFHGGLAMKSGDATKMWLNTGWFITEITIPTLVDSSNPTLFNTASTVQTPAYVDANGSVSNGQFYDEVDGETTSNAYLSSVLDIGTYLVIGGFNYFLASGAAPGDRALFRLPRTFSSFSYPGAVKGWDGDGIVTNTQGFVTQFCGHTPAEWQTALGNIHYCGSSSSFPIVSRTSNGPSVIMLDLGQVNTTTVTGQGLLYYLGSTSGATLGEYSSSVTQDPWSSTAWLGGCQMINLTRTMICLYVNGTGTEYGTCYGTTPTPPGDCGIPMLDPERDGIGYHAPPYKYMYMLYDMNKLKAVKDGTGGWTHENVAPYEYGTFTLAVSAFQKKFIGLAYDSTTQRLYTIVNRVWGGTDRDFAALMGIQVDITP